MDTNLFHLQKNVNKYVFDVRNYGLPHVSQQKLETDVKDISSVSLENKDPPSVQISKETYITNIADLAPFQKLPDPVEPHVCVWTYLSEENLQSFLNLSNSREIRTEIASHFNRVIKGSPRIIVVELMYSVTKFCKSSDFNLEQSGAILSMFYFVHKYFVSGLYVSAEQTYKYFRAFMLMHTAMIPPYHIKIFSYEEARKVLHYFCTIYLRNLPLIRLLCLPNFAFKLKYPLEPELKLKKKKKGKGKKDKGKKAKKGKGKKKK